MPLRGMPVITISVDDRAAWVTELGGRREGGRPDDEIGAAVPNGGSLFGEPYRRSKRSRLATAVSG